MPRPPTKTEARILGVLSDGLPHGRAELLACLCDTEASWKTIRTHVCTIRKILPEGHDILSVYHRRSLGYQHVILLNPRARHSVGARRPKRYAPPQETLQLEPIPR